MKNIISLLIFLLFAWLGIWWYYSCDWCEKKSGNSQVHDKEKLDAEAEALSKKAFQDSIDAANNALGLSIKDNQGKEVFTFPENFKINNTNGDVFIPDSMSDFGSQIADYLGKHQDQEIIISGYETPSETENSSGLGLSRADFIKNKLIEAGINQDRIITKSKSEQYQYTTEGDYSGGVLLHFNQLDEDRISEIEKGVANKTLYSKFGEKTFTADATLTNYTLELKNYLQKYPNKTVKVIGHTDDIGKAASNLSFGKKRADNVMNYLVSQGISKEKIIASSKGESAPMVPNTSSENRAKNRRIEIIVN